MSRPHPVLIALLIVCPALLRALEIGWNIVPIGALALFVGARVRSKSLALAIPLISMVLGDLFLGLKHRDKGFFTFHQLLPLVYLCYAVSVLMGMGLRRFWHEIDLRKSSPSAPADSRAATELLATRVVPIGLGTLAGSVFFFLVTNFGVWWAYDTYAPTWSGLVQCYQAGIPYFGNTVIADVIGSALLFGADFLLLPETDPAHEST